MELKTNIRPFYPWRPIRRIFTRRPQLQLHEKSITINNNMMPNLVFFLSDGVMELLCMRYLLQVRNRINLRCSSLTKRTLLCKEAGRSHLTGMYHNSEHPNHREYQKQVQLTVKFFLTLAFPRQILLLITEFPLFCIEFFLGGVPYPKVDGKALSSLLQEGYRMPRPSHLDTKL